MPPRPRFAVLDPAYTASVPRMQVLSGAFDTLSHAMETYFGSSDPDNVSDDVALAIMRNTVTNMRRLLQDINDMQARGNLMWDSAMAENGILKVGRVTDFQTHQIEHQLGAYTDCNHGQGLAVIHPAYYRHIVKDAAGQICPLCQEVFGVDTAEAGVDALADFIQECGLPDQDERAEIESRDHPGAAAPGGGQLQYHQEQPARAEPPGRDLRNFDGVHVKDESQNPCRCKGGTQHVQEGSRICAGDGAGVDDGGLRARPQTMQTRLPPPTKRK